MFVDRMILIIIIVFYNQIMLNIILHVTFSHVLLYFFSYYHQRYTNNICYYVHFMTPKNLTRILARYPKNLANNAIIHFGKSCYFLQDLGKDFS